MSDLERTIVFALSSQRGFGVAALKRLLALSGGLEPKTLEKAAAELPKNLSKKVLEALKNLCEFERKLSALRERGIEVLTLLDENYPAEFEKTGRATPLLYCYGNCKKLTGFAIVGTRKATARGRDAAAAYARAAAKAGATVISGAARGIDEAAHRGALSAGGKTGAVVGEGILTFLEKNGRFAKKVVESGGFILSQFPPKMGASNWSFPARNALIATLALEGVLLVEAPQKSGALITADYALRLKRKLYAHLGDAGHPNNGGSVKLLKECKARLTTAPEDLFKSKSADDPLLELLREGAKTLDQLAAALGKEVGELLLTLTLLEAKGKVRREGGYYKLN